MTTNTPHDIETSTADHPLPAQPVVPHPQSDMPFTPIETAFLRLFGHVDLFGGIAPALAEVVDALNAAHHVYGTQRYAQWAEGGTSFGQRIDAMEAWGRPELGLPSTEEEKPTPGDMLSRLEDSSLDADELQKVRALFGARIASALSKGEPLPRSAIENHESLLICNRNRSRQHEDWRTVIGHAKIDEDGLRELKLSLKSAVARDFIDDVLLALGSAIADPNAAATNAPSAGDKAESTAETQHEEDPTELEYGQPADLLIADSPAPESKPSATEGHGKPGPDSSPGEVKKISLIGWRIVDGLYAPFTRKLGVTTSWGVAPLADHTIVCRALKHDFLVGDTEVKNKVCVAYHSQQCSLPPQLVLTVPLTDTGGLFYDVKGGCYWAPYSQVLGKEDKGDSPKETRPKYGRLRIAIDPDLAQHHREQYARVPGANCLGDLLEAGATPEAKTKFLKKYRSYLKKKGDIVHPQYAGRHARSLGPAVKEITGSDVMAMFLALDNSMAAAGMMHYVTLSQRFVHAQQQRVLTRMGWKPPPDLPPDDEEVLGADKAISWKEYIEGWKGVQAEATEALAALGHASCLAEIESAWGNLVRARLLSFGCISGHRLTRIARLTGQAMFGNDHYICISDKVDSLYDAYRLLPVTLRIAQLRTCLLGDLDALHAAIARNTPEALNDAVVKGAPSKVVFFGLKVVVRNGKERLKRTGLDLQKVDDLSQTHFKREANIGRHQLVSGMVEAGVDHWLIRAMTGHHNLNAEVFGDASAITPRHFLEQLRSALDSLLADSAFAPFAAPATSGRRIAFTKEVAAPPVRGDAYVHPRRGVGGRLLPPLADRHTLLALTTTDEVRSRLLTPDEARDPWIDLLLSFVVFDGMHHEDVAEIWHRLPDALVSVAATCAAAWTREGRSNLLVVPLSPPTLAALARVAGKPAPAWSAVTAAAGGWLKTAATDVTWPKDQPEILLAFIAMAGRWLRLHLNPATYAASLRCVMSSALSAHSILRLATADATGLPVDVLSKQRALRPGRVRLRTGSLRQGIRVTGTVLFRYGGTQQRHGEDEARATKVTADLENKELTSEDLDADDHLRNEKAAEAVLGALVGHQPVEDLPALAALAVVRKEANLILDRHKDRRSWGGIATYWTEVALALELVSPSDDMRQWTGVDFEAWVELAVAAIALDARKKGKKGDLELDGLRRFLKVGRMLGWEVPPGLIDPEDIYRQDGMRQSSAATLLRIEDFQAARPLVHHALRDWPLAQKRADLLLDLLIEVPARTGELDTAFARCVTDASRMLCIQPAGFSALKNHLAVRLIALTEALADRLLDFDGEEIDGLGEFLFLDEDGDDWTLLKAIRDAIHQALLLVTGDVNLRFHAARGSAACRIAFPQWENWAKSLLSGTTGATFGDTAPHTTRESVAQAISALGHGRVPTFLGYYYSVWPWVRAHELRLTLVGVSVSVAYEKQLFETTQARRAAKSRAERSGQRFDHWDWIGRQMAARLAARSLESGQLPPVLTPDEGEDPAAPALAALTRYGLWTLAGVPSATAGHHCGVGALTAASMDDAIARLAPSVETVWERRGQPRGERGADTDLELARGEVGDAFSDHFSCLPVEALSQLSDCLAVDRRRLLLLSPASASQNDVIRRLATCMPEGLATLLVREPLGGAFEVDPALVLELDGRLAVGTRERDVGQHCLYQVAPADDPHNRKRTGPLTGLTRAACISSLAAHQVLKEVN
ncbi:hypothetical protein [Rubrivivax albus]|nr:hypothetical protein [Rubrivivax albus]